MAAVTSLADGYWNEAGVLSTAAAQNFAALSCIIKHVVMLGNGGTFSAAHLYCSSPTGFVGSIGVPEGPNAGLYVGGAVSAKFCSVGSVTNTVVPAIGAASTAKSIPTGQH